MNRRDAMRAMQNVASTRGGRTVSVAPRRVLATGLPPAPSLARSEAATRALRALSVSRLLLALLLGAASVQVVAALAIALASPAAHAHVAGSHVVKTQAATAGSPADPRLDPATRAALQQQLVEARAVAMRYPTVSDATGAGYRLGGGFAPRRGATYISAGGLTSPGGFDPNRPEALIYDGTSPTSQVIGLVYFAVSNSLPQGFAGQSAPWQRHSDVCVKFGPGGVQALFPADADVTAPECSAVQGNFLSIVGWTIHAWVVPSWENPLGVFSPDNPNVRCADGTYNADPTGYCRGT